MSDKQRADVALVERGLCESRTKAQASIMAGEVYVGTRRIDKASEIIKPEDELKIYAYHDGEWDEVQILELTEDGNAVCLFEHFCPVAFCVKNEKNIDPTGDLSAENLLLWIVMLSVSSVAVVVMVANRRKFVR